MNQKKLLSEITLLKNNAVGEKVNSRYSEFQEFKNKSEEDWFSELCFCILTANTSSEMGSRVQKAVGFDGFYKLPEKKLVEKLKSSGCRFYNRRADFIVKNRKHFGLKEKLKEFENERIARDYLSENVKGFGFKEASHFLRNTGSTNVAILDKHVVNILAENLIISEKPNTMNKKNYLEIECKLDSFAKKANLNHAKLDLYLWYLETGKVLK
ncbi:MAG: N-glycosylase/DNA lyase [archaeon]|nr:N-glycosylase/DNA lyase [archaeon]